MAKRSDKYNLLLRKAKAEKRKFDKAIASFQVELQKEVNALEDYDTLMDLGDEVNEVHPKAARKIYEKAIRVSEKHHA